MSNSTLSVVAYSAEIMGDLSKHPKFVDATHLQSNLAVWATKESGAHYPLVCLEGAAKVESGYVVLVSLHLGELFGVYAQTEDGSLKARHARGAVYIPTNAISVITKNSLDELLRASEEWVSTPVRVNTESVAQMLEESGSELRRWVIRDRDGNDTGARFPAISFGQERGLAVISCEEVQLESPIQGFETSWQITSFSASGDYRFRLPGAGGSSTVSAVSAQTIDLNDFSLRDVDVIADAQVQAPVTQVAQVPAAPAAVAQPVASQARARMIRS